MRIHVSKPSAARWIETTLAPSAMLRGLFVCPKAKTHPALEIWTVDLPLSVATLALGA